MNRIQKRRGYTLLELILALGLSIFVVTAIGAAIQLYLVAVLKQQATIERKQVARGVSDMIGNDLRGGVIYKAEDYSDLENLVQSQALLSNAASAAMGEEEAPDESEPELIVDEENVAFRPLLLGTSRYLILDVSRAPRLDEYNPLIANADSEVRTPSDIKSVAYFVSLTEGGKQSQVTFATPSAPGGLYRRSIDRAVASFRGDTNLVENPDEFSELVAGEIAELQFRYFDGADWQTTWDSEEAGGFPVAIEITLVLDPSRIDGGPNYSYGGFDGAEMESYRSVVHLPAAEQTAEEEE